MYFKQLGETSLIPAGSFRTVTPNDQRKPMNWQAERQAPAVLPSGQYGDDGHDRVRRHGRACSVTRRPGAMHVETSRSHRVLRDGTKRTYERHLLRRSFRDGGKIRKETLANLSHLPPEAITAIRAVLAGKTLIDADATFEITRSLPPGRAEKVLRLQPERPRLDRPLSRPGQWMARLHPVPAVLRRLRSDRPSGGRRDRRHHDNRE